MDGSAPEAREAAPRSRPLALAGWLPVWDVERRHAELDAVIGWTLERLQAWGVDAPSLSALAVAGEHARALAQQLTRESLAPALRRPLHRALRAMLPELPWDRVWVQTYAHFRILVPGDAIAPVPPHTDHGFGHGLDERNVWLALTDAAGSNALHVWSLAQSLAWHVRAGSSWAGTLAEAEAEAPLRPVPVREGDALLFTPLHVHRARPASGSARVSIDLRLVPQPRIPANLTFCPPWSDA